MKRKLLAFLTLLIALAAHPASALAATPDGSGPWADTVVTSSQGLRKNGTAVEAARSNPSAALGVAETTGSDTDANTTSSNFYSLGFGGSITVTFDNAISNGVGNDVMVYEVTGGSYADERVRIEASHNGSDWVTLAASAARDEALDLGILPCAKYVRVTDVSDITLFEATADGYDVDGIVALHNGTSCAAQSMLNVDKTASATQVNPGEMVTYTYTVTNPGSFNLSSVNISDDRCAPISGPTGDDGDSVLEMSETWVYTCSQALTQTTTNVVTVTAVDPWQDPVQDTDDYTVEVADLGCTLTQGYWKTHAPGTKHYDDTWASLSNSSMWLNAMNTPVKGNVWYQLAHQYVAAQLNILNGAYANPTVTQAVSDAQTLLGSGPYAVSQADRAEFVSLAGTLGSFNEGLTVTPHCSE
jgi:hypothetical protein